MTELVEDLVQKLMVYNKQLEKLTEENIRLKKEVEQYRSANAQNLKIQKILEKESERLVEEQKRREREKFEETQIENDALKERLRNFKEKVYEDAEFVRKEKFRILHSMDEKFDRYAKVRHLFREAICISPQELKVEPSLSVSEQES